MISFFSRPLRLVALVAVIGIAGAVYWVWHGAHTSTAVSQDNVLAEYRAKNISDAPPAPGVPASGVYRYRATGSESAGSGVLSAAFAGAGALVDAGAGFSPSFGRCTFGTMR